MGDTAKVTLGDTEVVVKPFSPRKALRVLKILRAVGEGWPRVINAYARFVREYRDENVTRLTRAQAQMQFAPRPLLDDDGEPVMRDGEPVMLPSRLAHFTDEDWERSGNVLEMPQSPDMATAVAAVFPIALDVAETEVMQLLALVLVGNSELAAAARDGGSDAIDELLKPKVDWLLDDCLADELLELAVVVAEAVEAQFKGKLDELGERVGKLRRVVGLGPTTPATAPTPSSEERTTSSSSSPDTSDGESETPSTGSRGGEPQLSVTA